MHLASAADTFYQFFIHKIAGVKQTNNIRAEQCPTKGHVHMCLMMCVFCDWRVTSSVDLSTNQPCVFRKNTSFCTFHVYQTKMRNFRSSESVTKRKRDGHWIDDVLIDLQQCFAARAAHQSSDVNVRVCLSTSRLQRKHIKIRVFVLKRLRSLCITIYTVTSENIKSHTLQIQPFRYEFFFQLWPSDTRWQTVCNGRQSHTANTPCQKRN